MSEKELIALWEKETEEWFMNKALFLLSYRPRSEKEMEQRLQMYLKKSEPTLKKAPFFSQLKTEQVIKKVIADFKKKRLINDQEFIFWWCEQRSRFRPRSLIQLKTELRNKGVDRKIIDQGLKAAGYNEEKMAKALLEKKLKAIRGKERKRKILLYLTRKGFPYRLVKNLIDERLDLA